jgi:hypothetical protein
MITCNNIVKAWNKFFFEERPTEGIALFRIVWMGLILGYYLFDMGNIQDFYGPQAIISLETSKSHFPFPHVNLFNLLNMSHKVTVGLFIIYGLALFSSMIGFFTRYSLILAFVLMTSFHQRNIWLLSSAEVLMRTITLYLIFSPCGHSLSVDSLLGRFFAEFKRPKTWPIWALRLIQIQISVVYLWTFWHKLKGDDWFDGSAVYFATRMDSMTNFTIPYLMDSMTFLKLATWSTLLVELSLGILVWVKDFRKPVILIGIAFHLGIELVMSIPFFELYMISLLINFYTPEELKAFVDRVVGNLLLSIENSTLESGVRKRIINSLRG